MYDNPLLCYQVKEEQFFHEVASQCLKEVLKKHNVEDKLQSTLKTSSSMFKSHYVDICNTMSDKLQVVGQNCYDIIDCFYAEYEKTRDSREFGQKVAAYIKGWWGFVLEAGLAAEGVDQSVIRNVSRDFFDLALPKFTSERTDIYPEFFRVLALAVEKL